MLYLTLNIPGSPHANFEIKTIDLNADEKNLRVVVEGTAGYIKTGTEQNPRDHRPTLFDVVRQNQPLVMLITLIGWLFPTSLGVYQMIKDRKA